jgi:hypothetical protein
MGTLILRGDDELRISSTLSIKTSCSSGGAPAALDRTL